MDLPDRRRLTDDEAFKTLSDLYVRRIPGGLRLADWEAACDMLDVYTRDQAIKGPTECRKRIDYLRVPEPVPMMEDCYPGDRPPMPIAGCALLLDLAQRHFEVSRAGYPAREEVRKKELEWALNLMKSQEAAEAARKPRSRIVAAQQSEVDEDSSFLFAEIAETPEQLERLFRDKHKYWELVGFVSVLVLRRNDIQHLVDEHRRPCTYPSGRRVDDACDLERLVNEVDSEIVRLIQCLDCYMRSAPFQRLFGDRDQYNEPSPHEVTTAAEAVTDFYTANLLVARTAREVTERPDLVEIVEDTVRLVDRPLESVDRWITKLVGFVAILPTLERTSFAVQHERHEVALDLDFDDVLLDGIHRRIAAIPGPLPDGAYLRKWEREFEKRHVTAHKSGGVSRSNAGLQGVSGVVVIALFITGLATMGPAATAAAALAVWAVLGFIVWLIR